MLNNTCLHVPQQTTLTNTTVSSAYAISFRKLFFISNNLEDIRNSIFLEITSRNDKISAFREIQVFSTSITIAPNSKTMIAEAGVILPRRP
jgi:hypothetical protein